MRLVRYGERGAECPGVVDGDGGVRDASSLVEDWRGAALGDESLARVAAVADSLPLVAGTPRFGAPVGGVGKVIVIGLNYRAHAAEAGLAAPSDPIVILVSPTAICGGNDDIRQPPGSVKMDWEIELGVVIGRDGGFIRREEALRHVAGYCVANDLSEREYQLERGSQWGKGKSCDTFKPLGPWLVTRDEVPNPQDLNMTLRVNGEVRQQGNTGDMVFSVAELVSRVSAYMRLCAGDVMVTGTPPGVGLGMRPPQFLSAGDVLHLTIDGLGEQHARVVGG